ncbi:glutathione S-transferase family protein [Aestuariispira insulae]|uniref:Glutathione S-transferase n=1 Tax=Aestuariispira insulae TaxID=1461337 RepID=A0A3D9HWF1_9PROT|nr:glutathione S-transferase family protein [Aestuariispira insulae]RED53828.1 glutathione S-transferase [Aestuariispira insulae]
MYVLYHFPYSQHARRVHSLLEEARLVYRLEHVAMDQGDYLTANYLAVNPNHQVPSLVDEETGVKIHESNAILRYLCVKHALDNWYPSDLVQRARVEQWLDWNQCRLSPHVVGIVLNSVFMGEDGDKDAIARSHEAMKELSEILDAGLADRPYLAGDRATIADLSVASNIFQLCLADAMPKQANINDWYARISQFDGFQKSLPT